jgi:hypothetical protein
MITRARNHSSFCENFIWIGKPFGI